MSLELNALFKKYGQTTADLDQTESEGKYSYDRANRDNKLARSKDLKNLAEKFAGKGLTHSGINLEENVNLNKAYSTAQVDNDQEYNRFLSNIARKRLEAENTMNESRTAQSVNQLLGQ